MCPGAPANWGVGGPYKNRHHLHPGPLHLPTPQHSCQGTGSGREDLPHSAQCSCWEARSGCGGFVPLCPALLLGSKVRARGLAPLRPPDPAPQQECQASRESQAPLPRLHFPGRNAVGAGEGCRRKGWGAPPICSGLVPHKTVICLCLLRKYFAKAYVYQNPKRSAQFNLMGVPLKCSRTGFAQMGASG